MIVFNTNNIRVRCLKCSSKNLIEVNLKETNDIERDLGYEYEYIYKGKLRCHHCNKKMKIKLLIFEYPTDITNYIETSQEACVILSEITYNHN